MPQGHLGQKYSVRNKSVVGPLKIPRAQKDPCPEDIGFAGTIVFAMNPIPFHGISDKNYNFLRQMYCTQHVQHGDHQQHAKKTGAS